MSNARVDTVGRPQYCACQYCGAVVTTRLRKESGTTAWILCLLLCLLVGIFRCARCVLFLLQHNSLLVLACKCADDSVHECPHCNRELGRRAVRKCISLSRFGRHPTRHLSASPKCGKRLSFQRWRRLRRHGQGRGRSSSERPKSRVSCSMPRRGICLHLRGAICGARTRRG